MRGVVELDDFGEVLRTGGADAPALDDGLTAGIGGDAGGIDG